LTGYLLDTHALIWWFEDNPALPQLARDAIADPDAAIYASSVTAFEMANKHRIGKLSEVEALLKDYARLLAGQSFIELAVSTHHSLIAGGLDIPHRDPFDRLLIAQAKAEDLTLISNEQLFDGFAVKRLWA
jgi:PIN domain nuclease of toxin-antitoxin system